MTETIENGRALVPMEQTVSLPIPVEEAVAQWRQYQELTRQLLDQTDYQKIGDKQFKKKSGWRKYARAFNITDRVTYEHVERAPDGFPLWARIRVEASHPNGRSAEADHECHISERCCPAATGASCRMRNWDKHTCCAQGCTGRMHWSHPGDLPATALTRAKNRAISDLIGAGEVSAEEMEREPQKATTAPRTRAAAPSAPASTPEPPPNDEYLDDDEAEAPRIIEGESRELPPQRLCNCDKPRIRKTGTSAKDGRAWVGWFCQVKGEDDKFKCAPVFENSSARETAPA
jgi:hypothetical protein